MNEFARRLKQARLNKGFTLEGLAAECNSRYHTILTKSTISKYENGKIVPSLFNAKYLCMVLGVSMDWITGLKD